MNSSQYIASIKRKIRRSMNDKTKYEYWFRILNEKPKTQEPLCRSCEKILFNDNIFCEECYSLYQKVCEDTQVIFSWER